MSNPFLEGNLGPIAHEHTTSNLKVTGTVPDYLEGRYLRNGSNPIGEIDPDTYHWFMGAGMVHGVRLADGGASWYRNRWVRSRTVSKKLGERPKPTSWRAGFDKPTANTNVIGHAGKTLALIEGGPAAFELTYELETVGTCDFDGTLSGGYAAHPKRDPESGELHAVNYSFARGGQIQYSVIGVDGRARRVVDIDVTGSPMMHDFSLTEKHVVFYDLPVTFDAAQAVASVAWIPGPLRHPARVLLGALIGRVSVPGPMSAAAARVRPDNSVMPYRWNPNYPARVGVMPREGGNADIRWFEVEPCYVFHPLNAYDVEEGVVLDVVRHPRMFATEFHGSGEGPSTLDRWTVDFSSGKVREERLDDRGQEFPRVDERLVGREHRYGWSVAASTGARSDGVLLKHDLRKGTTECLDFGAGNDVGEFVFHPRTSDSAEDDGVAMGYVYDKATGRSDLVILDAGTLEQVARVHLPTRVPAGFHGNWVAD
ncbi:MAG: carotenoid oxygenase family protein [Segniliparus sp.]|uniref:carotenoid oxygenase family protein n=1 Tax=Segniliparus sp. TaxID=2804064 RepID=UPI003F345C97